MDEDSGFANISWRHDDEHEGRPGTTASARSDDLTRTASREQPSKQSKEIGKLECTVSKPQKELENTKDAYISYLVTTDTDYASFRSNRVTVRRRFTDFVYLYKTLSREFPGCAVPPLPEKHKMEYIKGDRFSPDFTTRRAYSLQRFLFRICNHPVLRRTTLLITFLESDDWNAYMRSRPARGATQSESSGVFDGFGDALVNAFQKVHKPDKRFLDVREKIDKLDEDVGHIEKTLARVARRQSHLQQDYTDTHTQMSRLALVENGIEPTFNTFGVGLDVMAKELHELREQTDANYVGSLRDMQQYVVALRALLKHREQKQLDYEGLTEYLTRATSERDTLASGGGAGYLRNKVEDLRGVDHEQARKDRARRLEHKVDELRLESEEARKFSEAFDEEVIRETADFERIKTREMKESLRDLAGAHIRFYRAVIDEWSRIIPEITEDT